MPPNLYILARIRVNLFMGKRLYGYTPRRWYKMAHPDTAAIILTTAPPDFDTASFARSLLSEQLVACVNVLPVMHSHYRWQGAIESAPEHQLILKTTMACVERVRQRLETLHPYDVPEFLVLEASGGSEGYLSWLRGETVPPPA
jgi:periplasmic divalent cation tolerance protein